jgi:hypothetical protein
MLAPAPVDKGDGDETIAKDELRASSGSAIRRRAVLLVWKRSTQPTSAAMRETQQRTMLPR